jgi:hypothetical protein
MDTADPDTDVVYHVDPEGRITFVNSRWDEFARANDAKDLLGDAVLGRRVAPFIADRQTRHLFELIVRHALQSGRPMTLPYRCDGPAARRRMELSVCATPAGDVVFRSRVLAEEARPPIGLLDPHARRRPDSLIHICSWCNRGRIGERWAEVEEVIAAYDLFDAPTVPDITHGLCFDCEQTVLSEWLQADPTAR